MSRSPAALALVAAAAVFTASMYLPGPGAGRSSGGRPGSAATDQAAAQQVLQRYCISCHNARLKTASLALDGVDLQKVGTHPEIWEKVVTKLRTTSMPPAGRPRPDAATYDRLATWLETELDRASASQPEPGRPSLRSIV